MNASVPRTRSPVVGSGLADAQRSTFDQEASSPVHAGEYEASFNDGDIVEVEVMHVRLISPFFTRLVEQHANSFYDQVVHQVRMRVFPYDGYLHRRSA